MLRRWPSTPPLDDGWRSQSDPFPSSRHADTSSSYRGPVSSPPSRHGFRFPRASSFGVVDLIPRPPDPMPRFISRPATPSQTPNFRIPRCTRSIHAFPSILVIQSSADLNPEAGVAVHTLPTDHVRALLACSPRVLHRRYPKTTSMEDSLRHLLSCSIGTGPLMVVHHLGRRSNHPRRKPTPQ